VGGRTESVFRCALNATESVDQYSVPTVETNCSSSALGSEGFLRTSGTATKVRVNAGRASGGF
jgi:hypothetical protein